MKPKNPFKLDGALPLPENALEALEHLGASRRDFLKTAGIMMIGLFIPLKKAIGDENALEVLPPVLGS